MVTAGLAPRVTAVSERYVEYLKGRLRHWREEPLTRVSAQAALLRPWRRRQFGAFGSRSIVHRPTWLYGTSHMALGSDVLIFHGAWLAVEKRAWTSDEPALVIGDRVVMRPRAVLSAAAGISIGDDVVLAGGVSIIDSDHTWRTGRPNVLHNPLEVAPISVGPGTWIGEHAVILRGARIGRECLIAANSVGRGEIPDHSIAAGSPARVVGTTDKLR
jgi:acetyltransferase-like isoleucine patch superfamily enzyme